MSYNTSKRGIDYWNYMSPPVVLILGEAHKVHRHRKGAEALRESTGEPILGRVSALEPGGALPALARQLTPQARQEEVDA